jgi:Fur family transcriptional regulator, ferric uptake regulator
MVELREKRQFLEYLRQHNLRLTQERLVLFDEIFSRHGHLDAETVYHGLRERGEKISRATVYRNLDLLVECGLVNKHRLGHDRYLYEHVHSGQRHDHLVCTGCDRVVEFVSPGIAALQGEICRAHGFVPNVHTLQISSQCNACAQAEAAATAEEVASPSPAPH